MTEAQATRRKDVFHIVEREGHDPIWTRIGLAFVNRDDSLNLYLDMFPINGRLHVRDPRPRKSTKE